MRGETNLKAELSDGTLVPMDFRSENLDLRKGQAKFKIPLYILDWISLDIILGKAGLRQSIP